MKKSGNNWILTEGERKRLIHDYETLMLAASENPKAFEMTLMAHQDFWSILHKAGDIWQTLHHDADHPSSIDTSSILECLK